MVYKQALDKKIEILAPAGSYESFRAAIAAGADAVYAGGPRFGARAYAENFTEEQLLDAIDYAHLHGRRFYLTVNTLLKDSEITDLYAYLEPLYLGGLDAVIVQDVGVLEYVRTNFPELELHASTQMTITAAAGAQFLKEQGAVRVVPARELSLKEIRHMKNETGMEIECFVHGALCYCYSGQCLLSSLIGGRSGNRGQCAQPCRLPYSTGGKKGYLLSPKDICTLELIPELIEAGIDSFKIEGRMKRPEYVAGVTAMYRKYTDLYLENGREKYQVKKEDKEKLMDLYNRGGFETGYYKQHNGRNMIAIDRPNHAGVAAVKVRSQRGRELQVRALTEIHKGDILEFPGGKENYTFGRDYAKDAEMMILAPKGKKVAAGCTLYRVRNQQLLNELGESDRFGKIQEKIYGFLKISAAKPATLVVCCGDISVEMVSDVNAEAAAKSPLNEERVWKQMMKTGNTEFLFETLEMELDENVFLPMQQLNELRRNALEELKVQICQRYHRTEIQPKEQERRSAPCLKTGSSPNSFPHSSLSVLVETKEQLQVVHKEGSNSGVSRLYVDSQIVPDIGNDPEIRKICNEIQDYGIEVFLAMPHIFRDRTQARFEAIWNSANIRLFDGMLVRNYESYWFLKQHGFDKMMILDHNLYIFNHDAKQFWHHQRIRNFTVPLELNRQEIQSLDAAEAELIVYGYLPVMVSAQCITNTVNGCRKKETCISITDRYQNQFRVKNHCRDCYNVIYNSAPLCLFDEKTALEELNPAALRLQFSVENAEETKAVLEQYRRNFERGCGMDLNSGKFTRGHFRRGIT